MPQNKPMRRAFRIACVLALSSLAAGCGLLSSSQDRAARRSPAFREGYSDGCAAATTQSSNPRETPYRDEAEYKADALYRAGWANGYQICNPNRTGAVPNGNPVPTPLPQH